MKTSILLFPLISFFCLLFNDANSQNPNWLWANSAGGTGTDIAHAAAVDASGNVFVTGEFDSPTITFGSSTLTNTGAEDIFVAKYDAAGNVLWAKNAVGTDYDIPLSAVTDASGNVYLTGRFKSSTLAFGSVILTNSGLEDIFLVKYDPDGNVIWAISIGGIDYDEAESVTADASGNIYIAGYFSSPTINFGSFTLTNAGNADMFLAKLDAGGNVMWAISAGEAEDEGINSVAADPSGNTYVTGFFNSPTITIGSTTLTNQGSYDMFLAKFDAGGNALWAISAGGTADDEARSAAVDASGNVFSAGVYASPAITFGSITLTNSGSQDIYLVKYDAGGNVLWAKSAGGPAADIAGCVTTDISRNAYLTGYFQSPTITFGSTELTNAGQGDMFIVMYDANGNIRWAESAGGTGFDHGNSVKADASGNIYCAGSFSSPEIIFGTTTLTTAGNSDMFLAKLESSITSIDDITKPGNIQFYPNPATTKIHIESPVSGILLIHNACGKLILEQEIGSTTTAIDVSTLPRGIYVVKVVGKKGVQVEKFIKQ